MHKCIKCGKIYSNNAPELLAGCPCGSRIFLLIKEGNPPQTDLNFLEKLLPKNINLEIEAEPIENITVKEKGAYIINVSSLASGKPLIIKTSNGVYHVRLPKARKN
jgi:predicted  nucleic acid-binding Zn-ribbon protein